MSAEGNLSAIARRIGTSQQRLWYRLDKGYDCPAELVLPLERETGVSRHVLRPDLYPTSSADLPGDVAPGAAAVAPNRAEFSVDRKRA
ncbi:YdaS family helix-turn-helix protein [Sphingomonas panni]